MRDERKKLTRRDRLTRADRLIRAVAHQTWNMAFFCLQVKHGGDSWAASLLLTAPGCSFGKLGQTSKLPGLENVYWSASYLHKDPFKPFKLVTRNLSFLYRILKLINVQSHQSCQHTCLQVKPCDSRAAMLIVIFEIHIIWCFLNDQLVEKIRPLGSVFFHQNSAQLPLTSITP